MCSRDLVHEALDIIVLLSGSQVDLGLVALADGDRDVPAAALKAGAALSVAGYLESESTRPAKVYRHLDDLLWVFLCLYAVTCYVCLLSHLDAEFQALSHNIRIGQGRLRQKSGERPAPSWLQGASGVPPVLACRLKVCAHVLQRRAVADRVAGTEDEPTA